MKPIIKYIGLLLFSGLVLPFYNASNTKTTVAKAAVTKAGDAVKVGPAIKNREIHFFIYQVIAEIYLLELTN